MKKSKYIVVLLILLVNYTSFTQIYLGDHHIIHKEDKKNCNDNDKWKIETSETNTSYRNLSFDIMFDENCKYILPQYQNEQRYKQKVMKLCTAQSGESKNSLRLGWDYWPEMDKIELAFYTHINHTDGKDEEGNEKGNVGREYKVFDLQIDANQWVHVKMAIGKKGMFMSVDGEAILISRNIFSWSLGGETTYLRANSYFEYGPCEFWGYDDCFGAPQDMDFYIENAVMDDPNFPWKGDEESCYTADNLKLMNTDFEFTDQGPYVYRATNTIEAPIAPSSKSSITTSLPYGIPFTVVEPNINVTFIAANSIHLKPGIVYNGWNVPTGFHAKAGSHFVAKIEAVEGPIKILSQPWEYAEPFCFTIENVTYASMYVYFYPDDSNETIMYGPIYGEFNGNEICFDLPFYNYGNTSGVYAVKATFANDCFTLIRDIQYNYIPPPKGKSKSVSFSNSQNDENMLAPEIARKDDVENNLIIDKNLLIFPNPSSGLIHIELPKTQNKIYSIEVLNTLSLMVYNESDITTNRHTIDLSHQPNGIYFVKIISGNEVYLRKVVIE